MQRLKANYHTHTVRCRHAKGLDEEYVISAVNVGMKTLGFSDHEEITRDNIYPNNIGKDTTEDYFSSLKSLREKYKDKIELRFGLEVCYRDGIEEHLKKLLPYGLEYAILGQHNCILPNGELSYVLAQPFDSSVREKYVELLLKGIETELFSYVAHPELFLCATSEIDREIMQIFEKICTTAKVHNTPLELNLAGRNRPTKYTYPSPEFFKVVGQTSCSVVVGLDAHTPETIEYYEDDYAYELIDKYGLKVTDKISFDRLNKLK